MPSRIAPMRVAALVALVVNVIFNAAYQHLGLGLEDMRSVSDRYHSVVTPAPWAFAIWGVIYGAMLAYALYALTPSQRGVPFHDAVAPRFVGVNVLSMVWIALFTSDHPQLSVPVLVTILALAASLYAMTQVPHAAIRVRLVGVPFALLAGWLSVATIVGITAAFVSNGSRPDDIGWAMAMVATATGLGVLCAAHFRDAIFPAVVAWATTAIAMESHAVPGSFPDFALSCAMVSAIASAGVLVLGIARRIAPLPRAPQPVQT